jgi:hypothetical protein
MATVRALTYVDAWRLGRKQFLVVCARFQEFYDRILQEVQARNADVDAFAAAVKSAVNTRDDAVIPTVDEADAARLKSRSSLADPARAAEAMRNRRGTVAFGALRSAMDVGAAASRRGRPADLGDSRRSSATPSGVGSHMSAPLESLNNRVQRIATTTASNYALLRSAAEEYLERNNIGNVDLGIAEPRAGTPSASFGQ